jgi:hypothetical protein
MKQRIFILIVSLFLPVLLLAQEEPNWEIIGQMPVPVKGAQAVVKDSLIYVIGGYTDNTYSATNLIQVFNPLQNTWQVLSDTLKFQRYGLSACGYRNSLIMFGGSAVTDSSLEAWDFYGPTYIYDQKGVFNRQFATAQVYGNYLYIFGGYVLGGEVSGPYIVEYYIPGASITYTRESSYESNVPASSDLVQQMSARIGTEIYVIGGALNGIKNDIYRFDIDQLSWQKTDTYLLVERAAGAAVTVFNNSFVVIGGYNETDPALDSCERIFTDGSGKIVDQANFPKLNKARAELTAVFYDSCIYVFGGKDALGNCLADVEKVKIENQPTGLEAFRGHSPKQLTLYPNYPNPFNQSTVIRFDNNRAQTVTLEIFDITGRKVRTLTKGFLPAGSFRFNWNGKDASGADVPSGVYFYRVKTPQAVVTKRLIVLR